jgi:hypothetical protein
MEIQNELAACLLEIPDLTPAALGKSKLFVCGTKEIARLRSGGSIDIRLSHSLIAALGLSDNETAPGWVQMNVRNTCDLPAVVVLIRRAIHTLKIVSQETRLTELSTS